MKRPWMKWYPSDWRGEPRLRMCSLAARGLWADMISYMHESQPYGHFTIEGVSPNINDIAALVSRPLDEVQAALAELEQRQVFSRTADGVIYSRRMVRDERKLNRDKENGQEGGNPDLRRGTVPKEERSRGFKRNESPAKTRRIFDREGGKCHWCSVDLVWYVPPGQEGTVTNIFHVDHVVALCDGGTNDEGNLVAACAVCNHKRARDPVPTLTPAHTDPKAQIPDTRGQKEDAVGGAQISEMAWETAQELAVIAGEPADPKKWMQSWCGAALRVQMMFDKGWPRDAIIAGARSKMANHDGSTVFSVKYFEPSISNLIAASQRPLPTGNANRENRHGSSAGGVAGSFREARTNSRFAAHAALKDSIARDDAGGEERQEGGGQVIRLDRGAVTDARRG